MKAKYLAILSLTALIASAAHATESATPTTPPINWSNQATCDVSFFNVRLDTSEFNFPPKQRKVIEMEATENSGVKFLKGYKGQHTFKLDEFELAVVVRFITSDLDPSHPMFTMQTTFSKSGQILTSTKQQNFGEYRTVDSHGDSHLLTNHLEIKNPEILNATNKSNDDQGQFNTAIVARKLYPDAKEAVVEIKVQCRTSNIKAKPID